MFVFVSDRDGAAQTFVARLDGEPVPCTTGPAKVCKLTAERGDAHPVWSPRGDWIAYSRRVGDVSAIHLVKPDGSEHRKLTAPGADTLDMWPTWSPNGRSLAFGRVVGETSSVNTISVTGSNLQRLETSGSAFEPSWSANLP